MVDLLQYEADLKIRLKHGEISFSATAQSQSFESRLYCT